MLHEEALYQVYVLYTQTSNLHKQSFVVKMYKSLFTTRHEVYYLQCCHNAVGRVT